MKRDSRRGLRHQDLRTLGVRPGLMATRYAPDGKRATIFQLSPEGPERREQFIRRLRKESESR